MSQRGFDRARCPLEWYSTAQDFTLLVANSQTNDVLYSAQNQGTRNILGSTVTRILIDVAIEAVAVAQNVESVFFGILIANRDARIAAALPDPQDQTDRADWLVKWRMHTIQDSLSDSSQWDRRHMDIRS